MATTIPEIQQPTTNPAYGAILYWNGATYQPLTPGAAGKVLYSTGTTGLPAWGTDVLGSDGTADAAAGYRGQVIQGQVLIASHLGSAFTSAQFGNVTSLSLTAGDWELTGTVNVEAGTFTVLQAAISAFSENTTTDHVPGYNINKTTVTNNASHINVFWNARITATATYYLKAAVTGTQADILCGTLTARRMR